MDSARDEHTAATSDGRRARRERGRAAVIEALLSLIDAGDYPVSVETLAERSGVSEASIFRYFDSLDDLLQQGIARHFERFDAEFQIPHVGRGDRSERIRRLVQARLALYEAIAPVARVARHLSLVQDLVEASLQARRALLIGQLRVHFASELATRSPAAADDLVGTLHTLTSFEAWDLLTRTHDRTRAQIRRAWTASLEAVIA